MLLFRFECYRARSLRTKVMITELTVRNGQERKKTKWENGKIKENTRENNLYVYLLMVWYSLMDFSSSEQLIADGLEQTIWLYASKVEWRLIVPIAGHWIYLLDYTVFFFIFTFIRSHNIICIFLHFNLLTLLHSSIHSARLRCLAVVFVYIKVLHLNDMNEWKM